MKLFLKNKKKVKLVELKSALSASFKFIGEMNFWKSSFIDFLAFVCILGVVFIFGIGYSGIVMGLSLVDSPSENVYNILSQDMLEDRYHEVNRDMDTINSVMSSTILKVLSLFLVCAMLCMVIVSVTKFFSWKFLISSKEFYMKFKQFFTINILWAVIWSLTILATIKFFPKITDMIMICIELALIMYFTPFLHLYLMRKKDIFGSLAYSFLWGVRPRSLLLVLFNFVLLSVLSFGVYLGYSLSATICTVVVFVVFLMLPALNKTILFNMYKTSETR